MYYIYRGLLGFSEEEFWNATPKKIIVLYTLHIDFENAKWGGGEDSDSEDSALSGNESRLPDGSIGEPTTFIDELSAFDG